MNSIRKRPAFHIVCAAVLIVCSYCYLDKNIALVVNSVLQSSGRLEAMSANIPDLLFLMVCVMTGAAWITYFYDAQKGITSTHTRFFFNIANTVPLSFLSKSILQFVIGRSSTRHWLHSPGMGEFHWFHGGAFPSGHMAVFTVVVAALWTFYPRYRLASGAVLLGLAVALIATDYHFLSDVLAGAYLGWAVHHYTLRGIASLIDSGEGDRIICRE